MTNPLPTRANSSILSVWLLSGLYFVAGAIAVWACVHGVVVDGAPPYVLFGALAGAAAIAGAFFTARLAMRRRHLGR